jgi:kynurenine 3-monooxygenase
MENRAATVVGAGLVGSLLSCYLSQDGYQVDVFEMRPDMRGKDFIGGRSINLALSDRGLKALEGVGLRDEIQELCLPMKGRMMHSKSGDLQFQAYGRTDQHINSVSRGGLNKKLIELADSFDHVNFHFDHKLIKYNSREKDLLFQNAAGEMVQVDSPLIFGTDGAFSRLRYSLQKRPLFNYSQDYLEHGYKELSIPPGKDGDFQLDPTALHIWPRNEFMLIALPNLDRSFTLTLFLAFEGETSFAKLKDEQSVWDFFQEEFADCIPMMPHLAEEFFENPTAGLVTVKCFPWAYENALLIGDACHAIVPFYGQGMNAGFEDCTLLFETQKKHGDNWPLIFEEFQHSRKPDADAIAELAKRNFIEMRDRVADPQFLLQKEIAAEIEKRNPGKFSPVYSLVTFSHQPYSHALSEMDQRELQFQEILNWPGIKENWRDEEKLQKIEAILLN